MKWPTSTDKKGDVNVAEISRKLRSSGAFVAMLLALVPLVFYQNCGRDISLGQKPQSNQLPPRYEPQVNVKVCSQADAGLAQEVFRINPILAMNLNAKLKFQEGELRLLADSDIDGLTDDEDDEILGRTQEGLLGSICKSAGGTGCNTTSCVVTQRHFGLSNCDKGALALSPDFQKQDLDKDLAPDFLEVIFGLLPKQRDTNPDSDSFQTIQEFAVGRNPMVADDDIPEGLAFQSRRTLLTAKRTVVEFGCPVNQELWTVGLERMPLVSTQAFADTDRAGDVFDLSHAQNENVILFYYYSRNLSASKTEIRGALVRVKANQPAITLMPSDFKLIGGY